MDVAGAGSALPIKIRPVGRTVRVVVVLVLALGVATLGLLTLEPARGKAPAAALVGENLRRGDLARLLTQTGIPIQTQSWRRAVVVAAALNSAGAAQPFCHFIIYPDGKMEPTDAWINQVRAAQGDDRVHVLVRTDWSACYPLRAQNETLVSLLRLVYQLGQPREWEVTLDSTHAPAAKKRGDWMRQVAANVAASPAR